MCIHFTLMHVELVAFADKRVGLLDGSKRTNNIYVETISIIFILIVIIPNIFTGYPLKCWKNYYPYGFCVLNAKHAAL